MAIFLISLVPAVFAVNDNANGQGGQGGAQAQPTLQQEQTPAKQARAEQAAGKMENMRDRYQTAREKFAQNREQMKERLAMAKEKRAEAKAKHQEARQKIQDKKQELAACKASETENCKQLRKETRKQTKNYLSGVAEHILGMIAKTKENIQASKMPEAQKAEMIAKLDAKAEEIAGALEITEGLTEESTKEDFQEAANIIKESWNGTKDEIKKGAGQVAANKIRALNTRMEQLQTKLHSMVQRLETAGADTTPVKAQLEEFGAKLSQSKAAEQEAQNRYQSGNIAGAVEKTKEAHKYLVEAHKALKQFVQNMKQVRGGEQALKARERAQERIQEGAGEQEQEQEEQAEEPEETPEDSEGNETA